MPNTGKLWSNVHDEGLLAPFDRIRLRNNEIGQIGGMRFIKGFGNGG
jgi:hypothetical protein